MKESKVLRVIMLSLIICIASISCRKSNESPTIPVTGITFNENTVSLVSGSKLTVVPVVTPGNATNKQVNLSSDNNNVATVDANGLVTGKSVGTAIITATTADSGKTAKCTVIVTAVAIAVTGITVTPQTASIEENKTVQITANVLPTVATDKNVSWKSDNTDIATVDANGLVTGKSVGTAVVTATTADGGKTATCTISITNSNALVTWFISSSNNIEGSPAGTAQKMKDALIQIKTAKAQNRFAGNKKAVVVVNGTITPTVEGSLSNKSLVSITGAGVYPSIVLRGSSSGGILDANSKARVLYVVNNDVIIADNITLANGNTNANNELYGGGVYVEKSSLTMIGGNIKNCNALYGGGICMLEDKESKHSSFVMSGGTVSDCKVQGKASTAGAGIFVDMYCSFILSGGFITNNGTDGQNDNGGGVNVNGHGVFTMNGGEISGNMAIDNGGGVNISAYGIFNMNGGTVTNNTAPAGGGSGVAISPYGAVFNQTGGSISGNNGNPDLKQ
ncbi:MAG: Ig-like domain-containing protein [Prevotellaceae bacterium]|jgi:hypothetical protein|nr:Ig-like domain-containing protein [Prevotellaceae bacterium]